MNKSLGQCIKESLEQKNTNGQGNPNSETTGNTQNLMETPYGNMGNLNEHFKYIKILLAYNIIDFTCKLLFI